MWDLNLRPWDVLLRISLALFFGLLIGFERQRRHKAADIRTMILVALGSCVFILAADEITASTPNTNRATTLLPVIAGLIGGVGFLGAGAIIHNEGKVQGVTTAAAIWITAAIGITCGIGEFALSILTGTITFITLALLRFGADD